MHLHLHGLVPTGYIVQPSIPHPCHHLNHIEATKQGDNYSDVPLAGPADDFTMDSILHS